MQLQIKYLLLKKKRQYRKFGTYQKKKCQGEINFHVTHNYIFSSYLFSMTICHNLFVAIMYHSLHSFLETWTPFWYFDASSSVSNILPVVSFREKSVLLQSTEKKPGHFVWPYRISQKIKAMLLFHMVGWVGGRPKKTSAIERGGGAIKIHRILPRDKGQIKPKADWQGIDSSKKRTNKFAFLLFTAKKTNSFVLSFFWRIFGSPILLLVLSDL